MPGTCYGWRPPQRLSEAGQLAEALIYLGRPSLAAVLQQGMSLLVKEQAAAATWIAANPPPPEASGGNGQQAAADRATHEQDEDWKWAILRSLPGPAPVSVPASSSDLPNAGL